MLHIFVIAIVIAGMGEGLLCMLCQGVARKRARHVARSMRQRLLLRRPGVRCRLFACICLLLG